MSYTYATFKTSMANALAYGETDPDFVQIFPTFIDYAEGRCYRDLNLLDTMVVNSSGTLTADSQNFTLPAPAQGAFTIIDGLNVIDSNGLRHQLTPVSRDYLYFGWPATQATSSTALPTMFAMLTSQTLLVAPSPGANFGMEVVGRVRPNALSVSNPTTVLTSTLPELFFACAMISAAGFMKNYGGQADDPKMSQSWESQYQALLANADRDAARAGFAGASWTSNRTEAAAVPQRG